MTTDVLTLQSPSERKLPEGWLLDDLVFATGGKGFGVAPNGTTVCLGAVDKVVQAIETKVIPVDWLPAVKEVVQRIIEIREVIQSGKSRATDQFKAVRVRGFRNRPARDSQHRTAGAKRPAAGKRLPGRKVKQPQPRLLD